MTRCIAHVIGACTASPRRVPIPRPRPRIGFVLGVFAIGNEAAELLVGHLTIQTNAAVTVGKNCLRADLSGNKAHMRTWRGLKVDDDPAETFALEAGKLPVPEVDDRLVSVGDDGVAQMRL